MEGSRNSLVTKMFTAEKSQLAGASPLLVKSKLVSATISSRFRTQLQSLIQKLESTVLFVLSDCDKLSI